jgi:DNA-binding CsgD family transcriptional regulator
MRRLVLEIPHLDLAKSEGKALLKSVKSVEVLHFLRHDPKGFAAISKIELANDETRIEDALRAIRNAHGHGAEIQLLERRGERTYTCFMKGKLQHLPIQFDLKSARAYITTPFELRAGKLRLTALGGVKEVNELARRIERSGIRCRVVSLTDAKFLPDSPLSRLTEKQRKVLMTAYHLGYYDRPRRINSQQLAKRLNLASSTLVVHRQKAERRLLKAILDRS